MTKTDSLDDLTNMSINRSNFNRTAVIKNKIKNISKISKELKKFK